MLRSKKSLSTPRPVKPMPNFPSHTFNNPTHVFNNPTTTNNTPSGGINPSSSNPTLNNDLDEESQGETNDEENNPTYTENDVIGSHLNQEQRDELNENPERLKDDESHEEAFNYDNDFKDNMEIGPSIIKESIAFRTMGVTNRNLYLHNFKIRQYIKSGVLFKIQEDNNAIKTLLNNDFKKIMNYAQLVIQFEKDFRNMKSFKIPEGDEEALTAIFQKSYSGYENINDRIMYYIEPDKKFPIWYHMHQEDVLRMYYRYDQKYGNEFRGYDGTSTDFLFPDHDRIEELEELEANGTINESQLEELDKRRSLRDWGIFFNVLVAVVPIIFSFGTGIVFTEISQFSALSGVAMELAQQGVIQGTRNFIKTFLKKGMTKIIHFGMKEFEKRFPNFVKNVRYYFNDPEGPIQMMWKNIKDYLAGKINKLPYIGKKNKGMYFIEKGADKIGDKIQSTIEEYINKTMDSVLDEMGLVDDTAENGDDVFEINYDTVSYQNMSDIERQKFEQKYLSGAIESFDQVLEEMFSQGMVMDDETIESLRAMMREIVDENITDMKGRAYITDNYPEQEIDWNFYDKYVSPFIKSTFDESFAPEQSYEIYHYMMDSFEQSIDAAEQFIRAREGSRFNEEIFDEVMENVIEFASESADLSLINNTFILQEYQRLISESDDVPELGGPVKDGVGVGYDEGGENDWEGEDWHEAMNDFKNENGQVDLDAFQSHYPHLFEEYQNYVKDQTVNGHPLFQGGLNPIINPPPKPAPPTQGNGQGTFTNSSGRGTTIININTGTGNINTEDNDQNDYK